MSASPFSTEAGFVGEFWRATVEDAALANHTMELVAPDMLSDPALRGFFDLLRIRFSQGEPCDTADLGPDLDRAGVDEQAFEAVDVYSNSCARLPWYTERIVDLHRARGQVDLLRLALGEAEKSLADGGAKARKIADRASMKLLEIFASDGRGQAQNLADILKDEREAMDAEQDEGVPVPFPRLDGVFGPLVPGDVVGLSAFSGGGKSTVAANFALRWARRGVPVLAFPTEMRRRWVSRVLAAEGNVRQWVAEKRRWKKDATDDEREAYRQAIAALGTVPLEVVNRPNISPAEIVAATRVLRKRWSGRTVVVIVDHMHRLNYEGEDPNEMVGPATKMLKDFASDDRCGGLVFLCLFQPRKPPGIETHHRPVAAAEIRGNSVAWNEIDVHVSPFRMWVKASELHSNAWGEPACHLDPSGKPIPAKPNADGAKLDDEHMYFTVDKRRIGGDYGKILTLDFHAPSGRLDDPMQDHPDSRETAA